jgi:hypothetical protein
MRRVTWLVALAAAVALALPSGGRATAMQVARPVPDFNNDGFGDLAVGLPGEDVGRQVDAGAIIVLEGRPNGMRSNRRVIDQDDPGVVGPAEAGDRFGAALAAGRFNRDGYWDLAVGAPGEDVGRIGGAGAVTILFGSEAGLTGAGAKVLKQPNPERGDAFGFSLAVGEISGPAGAELAVGAPGETVRGKASAGAVLVISRPGIAPAFDVLYQGKLPRRGAPAAHALPGIAETGDLFGWDVAANDFLPAEGRDSLAIGAPGENVGAAIDAGVVVVRYATRATTVLRQPHPERGDRFGTALGDGYLTRSDGTVDLAVGAPGETVGEARRAGAVSVFQTDASGFLARGSRGFWQGAAGVPGMPEADDRFGFAVAVGGYGRDVGGLAVGVPGEDLGTAADAGIVNVLYGLGGVRTQQLTQRNAGGAVEAGDRFGAALSRPFTYDQDLRQDLGVGAPGETVRGKAGAGAASVLFGGASGGLGAGDTQIFYQGVGGVGGAREPGDAFGRAFS